MPVVHAAAEPDGATWLQRQVARLLRGTALPGRFQVYRLARKLLGEGPLPFTIPLRHGGVLTVESPDWRQMYYLGDLELDVARFASAHIRAGDTVVDVGASIGIFAVPLARCVGPGGRVIALEALRANFESLQRNLDQNGLTNVECHFGAVSDQPGVIEAPDRPTGNYSLASEAASTIPIPARTLDDVAAGVGTIHLMKMDIEGSETRALRGAQRLFRERRVKLTIVEFNHYWLTRMGSSGEELYDLFEEYELEVLRLNRFGAAQATSRAAVLAECPARAEYLTLVLRPQN